LEKTNMKSRNKIKMSSGNSIRCVGEVNENLSIYQFIKNLTALLHVNYRCNEVLQTVHHHK